MAARLYRAKEKTRNKRARVKKYVHSRECYCTTAAGALSNISNKKLALPTFL